MDNIERINSVQYELYSQKFGLLVIQEPKGWSNDSKSFNRDTNSRGITSKVDIDLEFFGNASDYIRNVYDTLGVEERIILTKYEKNRFSLSEEWEVKYIQELDLTTYKIISRTGNVTINSREGGLFSDIKNRESDEYDLLDDLSADEVDIGALTTHVFQPLGRKLFVESLLEGGYTGYRINGFVHESIYTASDETSRAIPLEIVYSSNPKDLINPFSSDVGSNLITPHTLSYEVGEELQSGDMFFFRAEQDIDLSLKLDLKYKITLIQIVKSEIQEFSVNLIKTNKVGETDLIKEVTPLMTFTDFTLNADHTYNDTFSANLLKDESLALVFTFKSTYDGIYKGYVNFYLNVLKNTLVIQDTTAYEDDVTISKCVKPLDFFDRIVSKITGKTGLVKSTIFEEGGEYEFTVIDNGLWARGFLDAYQNGNDEEQRIQLSSSFKTAFESFNYLEPLCWYTEIIGGKEYIRIEKATYTQQNFIGIKLGSVDKIEYESSKLDYFSSVTIGQEKSLEFEELNGLDETNGKSQFTTFVTKNESKYDVVSKFRTDAVGYELTRRLPFSLYPKEDSKRDNELWMHDAYALTSGTITHKKWDHTGRFTEIPIGIYDPNSAWNLWLSPMNRLYHGHSYSVKRGLYHYPDKKIRFNSSNANQNLITQKDSVILSESGSISVKDMPSARVEATKISFTFKMTQEIDKMFKNTTKINGLDVPNYFGLIEFLENGVKKYGRLVKLESSDEAKITLIKARI